MSEPWYVTAFGADYTTVYAHRDLASAREEVAHLVELGVSGRVLDLCCGFGRHSVAMTERGLDVFGLDLSPELLAKADLGLRLVRADARHVPFASASFDSVVNLFSSFGYFGDAGDAAVLDEIARLVRPGGLAVMDLMNPDRIRAALVPESVRETEAGRLEERRALEGSRVTKEVRLTAPDGTEKRWREDVRMYAHDELRGLVGERGFEVVSLEGDFTGAQYGPEAERQLVGLRKHPYALR